MPQSPTSQSQVISRTIECNKIDTWAPFHWLALAINDMTKAPLLCFIYGSVFSLVPMTILYLAYGTGNFFFIFPAAVAFALVGPVFAVGLYDVAWELEKGHKPTLKHSLRSMFRNPVAEWGFAFILMVMMILWMRVASIVYALYPSNSNPTLEQMSAFLMLGTLLGSGLSLAVFMVSAFTPQIVLERKVDIVTAILSSIHAVKENPKAMFVWAACLFGLVVIGFATGAIGFIVIMPLLSLASWHAYIATIKTKRERHYE